MYVSPVICLTYDRPFSPVPRLIYLKSTQADVWKSKGRYACMFGKQRNRERFNAGRRSERGKERYCERERERENWRSQGKWKVCASKKRNKLILMSHINYLSTIKINKKLRKKERETDREKARISAMRTCPILYKIKLSYLKAHYITI